MDATLGTGRPLPLMTEKQGRPLTKILRKIFGRLYQGVQFVDERGHHWLSYYVGTQLRGRKGQVKGAGSEDVES